MFRDIINNKKIILPITIISLIFLVLSINVANYHYSKNQSYIKLKEYILLTTKISKLLHETQKERGMSSVSVNTHNNIFKYSINTQRKSTDKRVKELKDYLKSINSSELKNIKTKLKTVLDKLNKIHNIRNLVDSLKINTNQVISYYTNLNTSLLDMTFIISHSKYLTHNIIAYNSFLHFKENAGVERALGIKIITGMYISQNDINKFNALIVKQNVFKNEFIKYSSDDFKLNFKNTFDDESIDRVNAIRESILSANPDKIFKIPTNIWFNNITYKINLLNTISDDLTQSMTDNIQNQLNNNNKYFYIFIILNSFAFILFIFMIKFIVELIQNAKKLKKFVDKYIIISSIDLNGIITDVNEACCITSGYTKEEFIGKHHTFFINNLSKKELIRLHYRLKKSKIWTGQVSCLTKENKPYSLEVNIEPIFNSKGIVTSYIGIKQNITDKISLEQEVIEGRKKDQQMLEQSRLAQMGEMISMIAHQWRQPLGAISATSINMQIKIDIEAIPLAEKDKEYLLDQLSRIENFVQSLTVTIDDFRSFYKPNKQRVDIKLEEVVKKSLSIIQASLVSDSIDIRKNYNSDNSVEIYDNELMQVLLNIFKNSQDNFKEKNIKNPYIEIIIKDDYLEICDNGLGIPNDIIDKIFDPYYSTKDEKNGTGLGLYMSKTIIEEHHKGKLSVKNSFDKDGNAIGVCFIIELNLQ